MGKRINVQPHPDRPVQTNYQHKQPRPIEVQEELFMRRMGNLLTALQQTIQEMPGIPVLDARIKPFANSVIQAWQIMEPEAKKINKA